MRRTDIEQRFHQILDPTAVKILRKGGVKVVVVNGFKPESVLMSEVEMLELRRRLFEVVFPGFVVFALWLDGWFYPLVLLPFLYVKLVERRGSEWIGFHGRNFFRSGRWVSVRFLGLFWSGIHFLSITNHL